MKTWITQLGVGFGALVLTCSGALAQVCGGSTNNCCVASANFTAGCSNATCCSTVCAVDPYCCSTRWDGICATEAGTMCSLCGPPACGNGAQNCCVASPTNSPYCADATCCQAVCAVDPYCCTNIWDGICASESGTLCLNCGAPPHCGFSLNTCCTASANSTPYCSDQTCCQAVCAIDPYCCNNIWDSICATESTTHCLSCGAPPACGLSYNDCCVVSANNTPFCADAVCCQAVCGVDPYCCNTRWDGICASEAIPLCAACLPPCPADLNHDSTVDGADLGALLGSWGQPGGSADLNQDGTVDGADLGALLGAWGPCGT